MWDGRRHAAGGDDCGARLSTAQISAALKRARRRDITQKTTAIRAALRSQRLAQPLEVTAACAAVVRAGRGHHRPQRARSRSWRISWLRIFASTRTLRLARCLPLVADVRDGAAMRQAVATAVSELGSVDVLIAAAGIDSWGSAWELTDDQWDAMLAVNLTGVWQSAKAVSPYMISQRSGAMVFIGSVLSHWAGRQFAHYTAAKHQDS